MFNSTQYAWCICNDVCNYRRLKTIRGSMFCDLSHTSMDLFERMQCIFTSQAVGCSNQQITIAFSSSMLNQLKASQMIDLKIDSSINWNKRRKTRFRTQLMERLIVIPSLIIIMITTCIQTRIKRSCNAILRNQFMFDVQVSIIIIIFLNNIIKSPIIMRQVVICHLSLVYTLINERSVKLMR